MSEKYKLEIWEFSLSYDFLKISGPFPATITTRKYCSSQLLSRNSKNVHSSLAFKPRLSRNFSNLYGRPAVGKNSQQCLWAGFGFGFGWLSRNTDNPPWKLRTHTSGAQ